LEELRAKYNVVIKWRSFELRPQGSPPLSEEYRAAIASKRDHFQRLAREQYGVEINSGPFGVNSRLALIGAKFAEAKGMGDAYHEAVFRAYWQEAKSLADTVVLADIATQIGLDGEGFLAALGDEVWETAVTHDVYQAHHYGLNSVPAMVFAHKYLVVGAQPYTVLSQVIEQIQTEQAQLVNEAESLKDS
jgi:predicted DsbA family dithiol-disulfide isomerase